MMPEEETSAYNVEVAKQAFASLLHPNVDRNSIVLSELPLWKCMTDDVVWKFSSRDDMPHFGAEVHGKKEIMDLGIAERELLEKSGGLDHPEFITSGDRVVLVGEHSYKVRRTGVVVDRRMVAIVMDFRNGLISRVRFYEDLSEISESLK